MLVIDEIRGGAMAHPFALFGDPSYLVGFYVGLGAGGTVETAWNEHDGGLSVDVGEFALEYVETKKTPVIVLISRPDEEYTYSVSTPGEAVIEGRTPYVENIPTCVCREINKVLGYTGMADTFAGMADEYPDLLVKAFQVTSDLGTPEGE